MYSITLFSLLRTFGNNKIGFRIPESAKEVDDFIESRERRPLRLKNMFPVGLPDYAQWKEKGVVEKIDIESSDDESIEVGTI